MTGLVACNTYKCPSSPVLHVSHDISRESAVLTPPVEQDQTGSGYPLSQPSLIESLYSSLTRVESYTERKTKGMHENRKVDLEFLFCCPLPVGDGAPSLTLSVCLSVCLSLCLVTRALGSEVGPTVLASHAWSAAGTFSFSEFCLLGSFNVTVFESYLNQLVCDISKESDLEL